MRRCSTVSIAIRETSVWMPTRHNTQYELCYNPPQYSYFHLAFNSFYHIDAAVVSGAALAWSAAAGGETEVVAVGAIRQLSGAARMKGWRILDAPAPWCIPRAAYRPRPRSPGRRAPPP